MFPRLGGLALGGQLHRRRAHRRARVPAGMVKNSRPAGESWLGPSRCSPWASGTTFSPSEQKETTLSDAHCHRGLLLRFRYREAQVRSAGISSTYGVGVLVTVLWLVGMTNLINLIDGVDAWRAASASCSWCSFALSRTRGELRTPRLGHGGALLGFLWFNFRRRAFTWVNGGAYFLASDWPVSMSTLARERSSRRDCPALRFGPSIPDTSLAFFGGACAALPLFNPDRRHIHHHLINMACLGRKVVISLYALTLVFLAWAHRFFGPAASWSPSCWAWPCLSCCFAPATFTSAANGSRLAGCWATLLVCVRTFNMPFPSRGGSS